MYVAFRPDKGTAELQPLAERRGFLDVIVIGHARYGTRKAAIGNLPIRHPYSIN